MVQISPEAKVLIASQAPGTKVHHSGIPFSDDSGRRLREWLNVPEDRFYDARSFAIVPMGFCYPGRRGAGDAPPRPECAQLWRPRILDQLTGLRLTLLVGTYAQAGVLGPGAMSERVRNFRNYLPEYFPLPHPSWRSRVWAQRNPWFEDEVLPALRECVANALKEKDEEEND